MEPTKIPDSAVISIENISGMIMAADAHRPPGAIFLTHTRIYDE